MVNFIKKIYLILSSIRLLPHWLLFEFHGQKEVIRYDIQRWLTIYEFEMSSRKGFFYLMSWYPEFRNLFYIRVGPYSAIIRFLCPRLKSLLIVTKEIGPGLFIQHGVAALVGAKSIGKDCWINQQITIGYLSKEGVPVLEDNVRICAGAKVLGGITIGKNSIVGANAVVMKNVPPNCTVVGVPAYIVRRDGQKVLEQLI